MNRLATWRSARFSAFGSTSVGRHWWGARPGLGIGSSTAAGARSLVGLGKVVVHTFTCSSRPSEVFDVRVVWAAIQIAMPTREPIPTSQANMPSLTGPMPPRPKPP